MASVDVVSLHWTNDISMRQFIDQFTHQLPQLLRTTSGYSDVDNINDIGTDEVFVVVGIQKQKRVIAETEINHFVSIPLNSPLRFRRLTSKKSTARSEATTLDKLHADDQLEGQRVEMECNTTVFNLSSDGKCSETLGRLTIRDTYNEKYLVARTVIEGEVSDNTVGIPVYLPITVQVAAESHKGVFRRLLGPSPSTTVNVLCEEVLVFDECPKGDYEYVNPMKYARSSMTSTSSQSSLPSGARGPQPCSPIRPVANPKPTFVSPACRTASICRSPESQLPLSMEGGASPSKLEENAIWQTLYDVPLNIEHFTVDELCRMLQLLRMPSLAVAFREQSVDGQLMMSIVTEESLVKDFNCSTFEAKKLIHFTKHQWRPKR